MKYSFRKTNLPVLVFVFSIFSVADIQADNGETEAMPEFDCVIEPSKIVDLGTAVPGVIGKIFAERSDPVSKGEVVAQLESSVENANVLLSKARAELDTSIKLREESAAFGHRTHERNQTLLLSSSISRQDIDKLETENRIAQLQILQEQDNKNIAMLEYIRAKAVLDTHVIRAPFEGVVMERFKSVGEYIEDDPVFRIAQLDPLHVEVILPVEYMRVLKTGRNAKVVPILEGFSGQIATVTRVDRVADAASSTFGARLSLPNPDLKIPAGLRCSLVFLPPNESLNSALPEQEVVDAGFEEQIRAMVSQIGETLSPEDKYDVFAPGLEQMFDTETAESPMLTPNLDTVNADDPEPELVADADTVESPMLTPNLDTINAEDPEPETDSELTVSPISESSDAKFARYKYWVLTPLQVDKEATRALMSYLQDNGVRDAIPIREGPQTGRVSLGLYGREANALYRIEQLDAIGIKAEMKIRLESGEEIPGTQVAEVSVIQKDEQAPVREELPASDEYFATVSDSATVDSNNGCYRVGPLADENMVSELFKSMIDLDENSAPIVDTVNSNKPTEYRVFATAQSDISTTQDLEGYLVDSGVGDAYRLKSGENKGRVSLGLYSSKVTAMERKDKLKELGVDGEVEEVTSMMKTYWINLSFSRTLRSQIKLRNLTTTYAPEASVEGTQCERHLAHSGGKNI